VTPSDENRHLFVVRIWREADGTGTDEWRGMVEHAASAQRIYFATLDDLADFIALRLGEGGMRKRGSAPR
jgi:hypothetical protein